MNLNRKQFTFGNVTKPFYLGFSREKFNTPYKRYSYESKDRLYDVDVRESDGDKTYHINSGFYGDPKPIHREIELFFNL